MTSYDHLTLLVCIPIRPKTWPPPVDKIVWWNHPFLMCVSRARKHSNFHGQTDFRCFLFPFHNGAEGEKTTVQLGGSRLLGFRCDAKHAATGKHVGGLKVRAATEEISITLLWWSYGQMWYCWAEPFGWRPAVKAGRQKQDNAFAKIFEHVYSQIIFRAAVMFWPMSNQSQVMDKSRLMF